MSMWVLFISSPQFSHEKKKITHQSRRLKFGVYSFPHKCSSTGHCSHHHHRNSSLPPSSSQAQGSWISPSQRWSFFCRFYFQLKSKISSEPTYFKVVFGIYNSPPWRQQDKTRIVATIATLFHFAASISSTKMFGGWTTFCLTPQQCSLLLRRETRNLCSQATSQNIQGFWCDC